ncbi:ABC transporter ATP-binding protein/permease [Escherichia coli]|uniref:ABC transporter ATP-binding protein/permease n=1 Tax=Escherichia coli TaxID=562 RepID=A0A484WPB0_ECOLX|nr:ABC transporter ATP-binding protein/permease [Escherichia coli]
MLPAAGVRGAAITRTAGRYFERLVSHDATFRVLQHLRIYTFSKLLPLSPAGLARYRQGELLNRVVADVDTPRSSLPARYLAAGRCFCGDYGGDNRVKFP